MTAESQYARFGSGKSVRRVEDQSLLTGAGNFADDANLPGQAYVLFLRSPHPHARIAAIDTAAAAKLPGVVAIVTGDDLTRARVKPLPLSADFKRSDGSPTASAPRHALAVGTVRFVGEAVAAVVADSVAQARDAMEAIDVRYEPLPCVVNLGDAVAPGRAAGVARSGRQHRVRSALRRCGGRGRGIREGRARRLSRPRQPAAGAVSDRAARHCSRVTTPRPSGSRCASPTRRRRDLRDSLCAEVLGIAQDKVRVLVGDVGGGFGMKTGLYPEDVVLAFCAREFARPLKWCAERIEEFLAATHGRDLRSKAELALDADGRVLALRIDSLANMGAYATPAGAAIQLMIGPWVSTSVYDIGTIDIRIKAVLTNTTPTGAYRGAGRPEAIYTIERLMDAAARKTGIDASRTAPAQHDPPGADAVHESRWTRRTTAASSRRCMDKAIALADWRGFDARLAESKRRGRLRGRGIATFLEWTGVDVFEERVTVTVVTASGEIEIFSATQAMGQGLATTFAQLAVDVFGVPIDKIRIVQGDTDRGTGFGSAGSRSLFVGGSAVHVGAERTVEERAGAGREGARGRGRRHRVSRRRVPHRRHRSQHRPLRSRAAAAASSGSCSTRRARSPTPTWPNGCHICEVEIDPDTGAVEVAAYWSVNDVGRVVNPMIVVGQLEGGAAQGIGQALCEQFVYDREIRPGAHRQLPGLRAAARRDDPAFRDDDGRVDAVPQQRAGREGRGRAGHDRRDAGRGQRGGRRARARGQGRACAERCRCR